MTLDIGFEYVEKNSTETNDTIQEQVEEEQEEEKEQD